MNAKNEKELRQVLKVFSKDQIFEEIVPLFTVVSAEELVKKIRSLKWNSSTKSVIDAFVKVLKDKQVPDEVVEEHIPVCKLRGVAHSSSHRTWTAYTFDGESDGDDFSPSDLEDEIKHRFLENNVNAVVTVTFVNSVHWIQVVEKKLLKNHRLKFSPPFYLAHFWEEPFIFSSKTIVPEPILQSLAEVYQYASFKFSNLRSRDLESMLSHLKQKGFKRGFAGPSKFNGFKETSYGKDFSQQENRRKYITDLMGPSPPRLANYTVEAKNIPWRGLSSLPGVNAETFDMKVVFQTNDTVEMLKDLAYKGILRVPPPPYVANLLSTGRNNIKLRVQGANYGYSETDNQTDG